jgi:hypothetical protein
MVSLIMLERDEDGKLSWRWWGKIQILLPPLLRATFLHDGGESSRNSIKRNLAPISTQVSLRLHHLPTALGASTN